VFSISQIFAVAASALALSAQVAHADSLDPLSRGAYLARITGCAGCHTPRTAAGELVVDRLMTGGDRPIPAGALGRFYPPNLTPDLETGIGGWSVDDLIRVLKSGVAPDGRILSTAMPWRTQFNQLDEADARAIAIYLKSLPAVANRVPPPIPMNAKPTP
jgi:mono/diheme cytochrome c family protein